MRVFPILPPLLLSLSTFSNPPAPVSPMSLHNNIFYFPILDSSSSISSCVPNLWLHVLETIFVSASTYRPFITSFQWLVEASTLIFFMNVSQCFHYYPNYSKIIFSTFLNQPPTPSVGPLHVFNYWLAVKDNNQVCDLQFNLSENTMSGLSRSWNTEKVLWKCIVVSSVVTTIAGGYSITGEKKEEKELDRSM